MSNYVREAANSDMPLVPPHPADWAMALGAGELVVIDDSQTEVTLNVSENDIVRGPFHKFVSTTCSRVRYGTGVAPTAAPHT